MKTFTLLRGWMVCAAILMLLGSETRAASYDRPTDGVSVVRLHGKARYSTDNQNWQPVKKGTLLQAGYVVQTAANSSLDIRLSGKGRDSKSGEPAEGIVRLEENTFLGIDQLSGAGAANIAPQDVELDLRAGQLAGNAGPLPSASRYEIKFSKGIVGVRNGIFHMTSSGSIAVPSGETVVVVLGPNGNPTSTVVKTGNQFDAATGATSVIQQTPGAPAASPQSGNETPAPFSPAQKGPGLGGSLRKF